MSAPGHAVEHHPPGSARQIEAGRCRYRHAVTRPVDQQHVLARGDQQQVGQTGAEHHTGVTGGDPAGHRNRAAEPDARGDSAVDQTRQQSRLLLIGAAARQHGRGHHGRDEGSGCDRPAERLDDDDELGQPEAGPPVLLIDVQAEPADRGEVRPEGRAGPRPGASSSSRAAARAFCAVRKPSATRLSSRWSSVSAIPIGPYLRSDDLEKSVLITSGRTAAPHPAAGTAR